MSSDCAYATQRLHVVPTTLDEALEGLRRDHVHLGDIGGLDVELEVIGLEEPPHALAVIPRDAAASSGEIARPTSARSDSRWNPSRSIISSVSRWPTTPLGLTGEIPRRY